MHMSLVLIKRKVNSGKKQSYVQDHYQRIYFVISSGLFVCFPVYFIRLEGVFLS